MKSKTLLLISFLLIGATAKSQSFQVDSTFQPFFDIRNQKFAQIQDIFENPSDGRVYLVGSFANFNGQIPYKGSVCYFRDGSLFSNYSSTSGSDNITTLIRINDTTFYFGIGASNGILRDTLGNNLLNWRSNYLKTVGCRVGIPYFFPDGSSLFANRADNTGLPCKIVNPPDTFPGSYIIKLTRDGLWDSTFNVITDAPPRSFIRYDSSRIIVYGNPKDFKTYNGVKIDGMCRIFLDGTLDTSFRSPLLDTTISSGIVPDLIQENGSFFISGRFLLKEKSGYHTLAKLNADGTLDSTFMNFSGAIDTIAPDIAYIYSIEPTPDSGFLVGGRFTHYQGIRKNAIAKIDKNGKLQPQFFASLGPDSANIGSIYTGGTIYFIEKSKFGGYYVGGWFTTWDNKPVQPIIRLTGLDSADLVDTNTSLREFTHNANQVNIYPNPTTNQISIETNVTIQQIAIFDVVGKQQEVNYETVSAKSLQLNLSAMPAGIYILRIETLTGEVISKKLVKH